MAAEFLVGEAARLTGLSAKTIRYYEDIGLIPAPPRRNPSYASPGYRVYTEADLKRLALVKRAKLLDLSLAQVKQLVEAADDGCCDAVEHKLRSLLEVKVREIDAKVRELDEMRATLGALLARGPQPSPGPTATSPCSTGDCGSSVSLHASDASAPAGDERRASRSRRVRLPIVVADGCCEPRCGPATCA